MTVTPSMPTTNIFGGAAIHVAAPATSMTEPMDSAGPEMTRRRKRPAACAELSWSLIVAPAATLARRALGVSSGVSSSASGTTRVEDDDIRAPAPGRGLSRLASSSLHRPDRRSTLSHDPGRGQATMLQARIS